MGGLPWAGLPGVELEGVVGDQASRTLPNFSPKYPYVPCFILYIHTNSEKFETTEAKLFWGHL